MKKTAFLLLIPAAVVVCVWLLWKPDQPTLAEAAVPTTPLASSHQTASIMPARSVGSSSNDTKPGAGISMLSHQAWIEARSASIAITQAVDPATEEPVGTIKLGGASGTLGETPPFYRLQLKTAKHPILLGDKDTRHHFVRQVTSVHVEANGLFLEPEIVVNYPRSASLGGFVFRKEEDQITQLGLIIPDVKVPEGDDPTSARWASYIRIQDRELSAEDLAKAAPQPLGPDTVLVMPTQPGPTPATARVLWLALDANGSFAVVRN